MIRLRQIKVSILKDQETKIREKITRLLKIKESELLCYKIHRKSIDARNKNDILFVYELDVEVKEEEKVLERVSSKDIYRAEESPYCFPKRNIKIDSRPIIVGSGPAGLFCAYMLAEVGLKPIILERGDSMENRIQCVERFFEENILDPESNIQFGEGGAGTFSDGKLNTLTKDSLGRNQKVFEILVENGAPEEILYIHNPHIGTDILRNVIVNIRKRIESCGGEFHYRSCVTNLMVEHNQIKGVEINHNHKIESSHVVLAIGHSARDTFKMLDQNGLVMKQKNFAIGVRIEHPREMIDESQYGKYASILGSASYKLTYQTKDGRGVYSFCMCPGGYVINASSEEGRLVVNGMSNHDRKGKNSNSAIVVSVTPNDYGNNLFDGMEFQRRIEEAAYQEGNGLIPVQQYIDFCNNRKSTTYGKITPNTKGKTSFGNIRNILPDFISNAILEAMPNFANKIKNYNREDALFLGVETRTSSPVVMVRDEKFVSSIKGLYPCGEGAGYAGGITTASVDGIKVAEKIVLSYQEL